MKVMIDGKEVQVLNDIRIVHDDFIYGVDEEDNDLIGSLLVVLTHEGVILDALDEDGDITGATASQTYEELAEGLMSPVIL